MGQVTFEGMRKSCGKVGVNEGIDFEVRDGAFPVVVGLSGPGNRGRSTTLRVIAGLESVSARDLLIDSQRANELRPADRGTAMMFRSDALCRHVAAAENLGFVLKIAGVAKAHRNELVGRAAEILRIDDLLGRCLEKLSGGQRQRVAIGRTFLRKPKVFLIDRPLSNPDVVLRVERMDDLLSAKINVGHTRLEAGQAVGLAPDAAWALAFDAEHRLAA